MLLNQAYRYELDPGSEQRNLLERHAGTARFAWNWALAERNRIFEENEGKAKFTSYPEAALESQQTEEDRSQVDEGGQQVRSSREAPRSREGVQELLA